MFLLVLVSQHHTVATWYGIKLGRQRSCSGTESKIFLLPAYDFCKTSTMDVRGVSYIHATGKLDWTKSATLVNGEANLKDEKQKEMDSD